jgi:hypothetical protein
MIPDDHFMTFFCQLFDCLVDFLDYSSPSTLIGAYEAPEKDAEQFFFFTTKLE